MNPQFISISKMANLITASTTKRGRPALKDINNFSYTENANRKETINWRCSNRSCSASLTTRKSTGNLLNAKLPEHNHGNRLLKKIAQNTENKIIDKYAEVQGATAASVLQEISHDMLGSNFKGQLGSASSSGAIRMKLYNTVKMMELKQIIC